MTYDLFLDIKYLDPADPALSSLLRQPYIIPRRLFYKPDAGSFFSPADSAFVLTDYDRGISAGRGLNCPVIALSHDQNTQESLSGTSWLILSPSAITPRYLEEVLARYRQLPLTVARTARMLIRELTPEDLPGLLALQEANLPSGEGLFFPPSFIPPSRGAAEGPATPLPVFSSFLSDYIKHQYPFFSYGLYALYRQDVFLGIAGFSCVTGDGAAEISYALLPAFRRQGYAGEALEALLDYGLHYLCFSKIAARIREKNHASLALAEKYGLEIRLCP